MPDQQNQSPDNSTTEPRTRLAVNTERTPLYALPFSETVRRFASSGGLQIPSYDWGGDGPPLVIAHATGLHGHTYAPLAERLRSRFHCYAIDLRGQGDAGVPNDGNFGWGGVADDFTAVLDGLGLSGRGDVYGIGHSQGGYSILQGELLRPGTFAGLFGFEPVVFTVPEGHEFNVTDSAMVIQARKRREVFESREAAYENYKSKPPFSRIDDDALRAYVEWGFDDLDDGTWRLKCRTANEAALFSNSQTDTLHRLHSIGCRVTLGLSDNTAANFLESVPDQHRRLKDSELLRFATRTHFGILEGIDEMADIIGRAFLEQPQ